MNVKKFYKTEEEFDEFHAKLKLHPCPHCNHTGYLILHGKLYGFSDVDMSRIKRGRRIFCSNKNNKGGCGRTFSILIANYIKNFMISAKSMWRFLEGIKDGSDTINAFRMLDVDMQASSAYRIFRKFAYNQPRIRTLLAGISEPPHVTWITDPVIQTIIHLKCAFKKFLCPVAQFQHYFQAPLLC